MVRPINTFTNGGDGSSSEMNANFAELWTELNKTAPITLVAGQALTANDALIMGVTATETYQISQITTDRSDRLDVTTDKVGQTFTTRKYDTQKLLSFIFKMYKHGTPGNITFELYATSGGLPTGTALGAVTLTNSSFVADVLTEVTIDFSPDVAINSNAVYAVIFYAAGVNGSNYYQFSANAASAYADGTAVWHNGSTWATTDGRGGNELYFKANLSEVPVTTGKLYKAEADSPYAYYYNNFVGFAGSSVSAAANVDLGYTGIMDGFSGLTPGAVYYLSNTDGLISTTPGSNSVKVGKALTTTKLLVLVPV